MLVGKVIGNVWATKKKEQLEGIRFLLVQPYNVNGKSRSDVVVAADVVGAGIGEAVIVAFGRAARLTLGDNDSLYQSAVVGIVDKIELEDGSIVTPEMM